MNVSTAPKPKRGRPPKSNEPETFQGLVDAELMRKHRVFQNGKWVRRRLIGIICEHLVKKIVLGDKRALRIARRLKCDLATVPAFQQLVVSISPEASKVL